MNAHLRRRCTAEFVGTFGVVFAPVALNAGALLPGAATGLVAAAAVSGLAVTAMIATFGPISAAHFNPAVTLGFWAAGRFPTRALFPYWVAQFCGAALAALTCALLFGAGHGVHIPRMNIAQAVVVEALITFMLMLVIIAVATDTRVDGALPALAIGLTVVMGVLIAGPLTGGSMNPARSLGPALFAGSPLFTGSAALTVWWVYLVGPAVGAVAAVRVYEAVRNEHESAVSAPELW